MNAQKLATLHPDLHEKYKNIMNIPLKPKPSLRLTDAGFADEKLLMAHAEDGRIMKVTKTESNDNKQIPVSSEKPSKELLEEEKYEKILEKNLDMMAESPEASGLNITTNTSTTPPTDISSSSNPPQAPISKPLTPKKTSLTKEIMFAILGLIVLAVYTIIWMRLLDYKI